MRKNSLVLAVGIALALLGLIAPGAAAAAEPILSLEKGIIEVGGKIVVGGPLSGVVVGGGETAIYQLNVENTGDLDAEEAELWDVLPDGVGCSDVSLPEQVAPRSAECGEGIIKWTGLAVPEGGLTELTYGMTVPTDVAPGHSFVNRAGVTRYKSLSNTPGEIEYFPEENINEELTESNTGPLLAEAELLTTAPTLTVDASTATSQLGNGAGEATIGETVDFEVTATIPAGSEIYPTSAVKDFLPASLRLVPGTVRGELDGSPLPSASATLDELADGAEVQFTGPFPSAPSGGHTVVLGFAAVVRNIAANQSGTTITDGASFEFGDLEEAGPEILESTVETPVVEPHLEVVQRLLPKGRTTTVVPGEVVEFETEVTDSAGSSTANEVSIVDTVPPGMEIVDVGTGTQLSADTIGWNVEELAPDLPQPLVYKLRVEEGASLGSSLTNRAVGTTQSLPAGASTETRDASFVEASYEAAKEGYEGKGEQTLQVVGSLADLSIAKTGPANPVLLGGTFTYKLVVENKGPSDAVDGEVEDALPAQLRFLSATSSTGACGAIGGVLTCGLGTVPSNTTAAIAVTVEAIEVGTFRSLATVGSETRDTRLEDNESAFFAEIVPAADLAITGAAPPTVEPDGKLEYTLHVENKGPSVAHKVKVSDPLPAGVDFVSAATGCAAAGTTVTCELAELAVGDSVDFHVVVHVPFALGGGSLTNTASVGAEEGDLDPGNNSSTAITTVGAAADLAITKTMGEAEAGKPLTYTLAVTNKGPSASSAVTVKDTLPAGTTFKSAAPSQGTCSTAGQSVTCARGPLASGGSAQASITVDVATTATGNLRNVASVEGPEPDPDKSNNESAVEGPVTPLPPTAAPAPNLKVVKTADTSSPQVGAPFSYHVEVSNMGGAEAKNVKVVDTLDGPVKVESIEAESGKCSAAGSTITCTIPSIPVGKTVNVTYVVVAESAGPLKNTVSAQAANGEKAPANNHAVKSVMAKAGKAKYTLIKTAAKKVVAGGKTVGFTITLRDGPTAMTDAKVCDRLPAALTFLKAAGARYVNGEACWTKKFVAAHKVLKLHLTARAVKSFKPRQARNVATAVAGNAAHRSATAAVRIKAAFAGKPGGVTG